MWIQQIQQSKCTVLTLKASSRYIVQYVFLCVSLLWVDFVFGLVIKSELMKNLKRRDAPLTPKTQRFT